MGSSYVARRWLSCIPVSLTDNPALIEYPEILPPRSLERLATARSIVDAKHFAIGNKILSTIGSCAAFRIAISEAGITRPTVHCVALSTDHFYGRSYVHKHDVSLGDQRAKKGVAVSDNNTNDTSGRRCCKVGNNTIKSDENNQYNNIWFRVFSPTGGYFAVSVSQISASPATPSECSPCLISTSQSCLDERFTKLTNIRRVVDELPELVRRSVAIGQHQGSSISRRTSTDKDIKAVNSRLDTLYELIK